MPSPPADPTCVVGPGETAEVVDEYWILPDGSTRETLDGCQVSPKARLKVFAEDEDEPPRASHAAAPANIPTVITAPDELTATTIDELPPVDELPHDTSAIVAVLPPEPERMPPSASVSVTTVVLAVGVAGVASVMGLQAVQAAGNAQAQQQSKEEERERQECGTASDSVLTDMRARLADFKHRSIAMPVDPVGLWEACDRLMLRLEHTEQMAAALRRRNARR